VTAAWTIADLPDLSGRLAVVTGANAGLGLETAAQLAGAGAQVVLACRDVGKGERAATAIRQAHPAALVEVAPLDLADLSTVASLAETLAARHPAVDVLVNNAGLMAVDESRTADGFEMQLGVNHLGHVALTLRLLPLLRVEGARVVTVASMGHRAGRIRLDDLMFDAGYRRWAPYFQSKLANLLFTAALQRRLAASDHPAIAVAAHPGASHTDLGTEGRSLTNWAMRAVVPLVTQPVSAGALPILRAATDPAVRGGEFYGPRWIVRGRPVLETPSRRARDESMAEALWDASLALVGLDAAAALRPAA
jgi:protochlorophyllide reductase